jgi:hypothetical protein
MVKALLGGSKTQTRRVVAPRYLPAVRAIYDDDGRVLQSGRISWPGCPHGVVGDHLWCREVWGHDAPTLDECRVRHEDVMCGAGDVGGFGPYYRADGCHEDSGLRWSSPIHLPRWASRITLEITDVRCQRLQAITEGDAVAEGVTAGWLPGNDTAVEGYARLWESLHGAGS